MSKTTTLNRNAYIYHHEKYDSFKSNNSNTFKSAAVAVDSIDASKVGKEILDKGGSVVDAAISALLCNGLLNSQSMGIGGGFFMIHYCKKDEKFTVIDAREVAPQASTLDMFNHNNVTDGGLSIAVPGEIKGYWEAHKRFGVLKWNDLFEPAIQMCNNGFSLPHTQHKYLKKYEHYAQKNTDWTAWRETYFKNTDKTFDMNSLIRRPKLGRTLRIIADEGESAFYNGQLTDTIINEINDSGGIITKQDLNEYKVAIKDPVCVRLTNGYKVNTVPPPSCGVLLNFMLKLLDCSNVVNKFSFATDESTALFYHHYVEASKFAFGLREFISDDNCDDLIQLVNNDKIIEEYRQKILDRAINNPSYYGSSNFTQDCGTAHLSIIGPNGDAVAITSSINHAFGSKIIGGITNIHYNNHMDDFAVPNYTCNSFGVPNHSNNYIQPGKRPVSSMVPLIALDSENNVKLVAGGSGGTRILTSCAVVGARNLLLGHDIADCVNDYRIHNQLLPNEIFYESDFPNCKLLIEKGHKMTDFGFGGSAVQAIERRNGLLYAVCDKRKGGIPYGY